jgi:hypothetical protein
MQETISSYNPLNDYRLILDLPSVVKKKIAAVKSAFDENYKGLTIGGGQAFIYLAEFSGYESQEPDFADQFNRIALGFMPFKLHLKNFGEVDGREIYVGIENDTPVQMLTKQFATVKYLLPAMRVNTVPRVTIAKALQPFQFLNSWKEYENKTFSATFIANKMLLLKRMEGFSRWLIHKELDFQNMVIVP